MKNKEYRIYEEYRTIGKLFVKDEIWIAFILKLSLPHSCSFPL